jgi:hypothetical protein
MHQLQSSLHPSQSDGATAHCAAQFAIRFVIQYVTRYETRFGIARANLSSRRAKAWKPQS